MIINFVGLKFRIVNLRCYTDYMYLGIDVGGTKTLVATLDDYGVIQEKAKFPTPQNYKIFIDDLRSMISSFNCSDFTAAGLAIPVTVFDRKNAIAVNFSNLDWHNVPIQADLEKILECPLVVENDAKLACLSEAMLLKENYSRILYVTISTGIGFAIVNDGQIDDNAGDGGGRTMMFEHSGKFVPWESFASGRAIVERYGKKAMDITDDKTWEKISRDLSLGFLELIAIFEPEVVIVGGSVGTYFERYGNFLVQEIQRYSVPLLDIPPIIGAQRPEDAVVYGCYDLAKKIYGNGTFSR